MKSRALTALVVVLVALWLLACGKPVASKPPDDEERVISSESEFGRATSRELDDAAFARLIKHHSGKTLQSLALPSHFGVTAFQSDGYVVINPRLLFRSVRVEHRFNNQVFVTGTVALVDGLTKSSSIPSTLLIRDREAFIEHLRQLLGREPRFASRLPCPIKMGMSATPSKALGGVAHPTCTLNTFYPVLLELTASQWHNLKAAVLEPNAGEIVANVSVHSTVIKKTTDLLLRSDMLHRRLRSTYKPGAPYREGDVRDHISKVLREAFHSLKLESVVPDALVGQVALAFFVREDCSKGVACLSLRKSADGLANDLSFRVIDEAYVGQTLDMDMRGSLANGLLESHELFLKPESGSPLLPPTTGSLNRLSVTVGEGDLLELDFSRSERTDVDVETRVETKHRPHCKSPYSTCRAGKWSCVSTETEKINPRPFCQNSRQECRRRCWMHENVGAPFRCVDIAPGDPARLDIAAKEVAPLTTSVCTAPESICLSWGTAYDERSICERLTTPSTPTLPYKIGGALPTAPQFRWDCHDVQSNVCDDSAKEDQWLRITRFSEPHLAPRYTRFNPSAENLERILDGLFVVFTSKKSVGAKDEICALRDLAYKVTAEGRIRIAVGNTPRCRVFDESNRLPGLHPTLSILNKAFLSDQYRCGKLVEQWNGKRRYVCQPPVGKWFDRNSTVQADEALLQQKKPIGIHLPFYPRVFLKGSLRLVRNNPFFEGDK